VTRIAAFALVLILSGCATATREGIPSHLELAPGQRPPLGSDEAGLWMQVDRAEETLRTSGRLVRNPGLNSYIQGVVCRVAGPLCQDLRVYVVQVPGFNASMAPNGAMLIWTGLVLRAENEAQLAYVVAHEVGHYIKRHSIQQWRTLRNTTAAATIIHPIVGGLGDLAAVGTVRAFSREHEREADLLGAELLRKAGYDVGEASRIWDALRREQDASSAKRPPIFFATHPPTPERAEMLRRLAEASRPGSSPGDVGVEAFRTAMLPLRGAFLRDELRLRDYARTQVLLDRLLAGSANEGEVYFFQGELYRMRSDEGDDTRAIAAYERSLELGGAPVEVHRGLALVLMKRGERPRAQEAFLRYLKERPDADDRQIVESYLHQLQ
jgi:Zn-dependent protease with chaperone function